jgi:hypothetical protein
VIATSNAPQKRGARAMIASPISIWRIRGCASRRIHTNRPVAFSSSTDS